MADIICDIEYSRDENLYEERIMEAMSNGLDITERLVMDCRLQGLSLEETAERIYQPKGENRRILDREIVIEDLADAIERNPEIPVLNLKRYAADMLDTVVTDPEVIVLVEVAQTLGAVSFDYTPKNVTAMAISLIEARAIKKIKEYVATHA